MSISPSQRYDFRKDRVRKKIFGTMERPRLSVYRSLKHIYVQVIDDAQGKTLASASSLEKDLRKQIKSGGSKESALLVGKRIAEKSVRLNIKKVVFDRGGNIYHGCVKAVADGARQNGLEF